MGRCYTKLVAAPTSYAADVRGVPPLERRQPPRVPEGSALALMLDALFLREPGSK